MKKYFKWMVCCFIGSIAAVTIVALGLLLMSVLIHTLLDVSYLIQPIFNQVRFCVYFFLGAFTFVLAIKWSSLLERDIP